MRANILLVDDEPSVLRYTKTLLEIDNYRVETAGSGEEAIERIQRGPAPNLIVLSSWDRSQGSGGSLNEDTEAKEVQRALDNTNWNRRGAPAELDISNALLSKIKQHRLSPDAGHSRLYSESSTASDPRTIGARIRLE